jgi:hypothetical protein
VSPAHLRAKVGLSLNLVAIRMGITVPSLRILESTPLGAWTVQQVGRYAAACGHVLRVVAVRDDGHEEELSS